MSYLRWTSKSTGHLATELVRQGFKITDDTVGRILRSIGYSLQAPSKQKEGKAHPDRDAQFVYLNKEVGRFMKAGQPVISVDTKKKEIVGEYSNGGAEWHPTGEPTRTKTHDFVDRVGPGRPLRRLRPGQRRGLGLGRRQRRHRHLRGRGHPALVALDGTAPVPQRHQALDHRRCRRIQRLPGQVVEGRAGPAGQETGLEITVVHYPPGTSKWNKIEHKMFSFISLNWRGRPLVSYRTIVELIRTRPRPRASRSAPKRTSTITRPAPRSAPPSWRLPQAAQVPRRLEHTMEQRD